MDKDRIYEILNKAYFSEELHEAEVILNLPEILRGVELFVDIGASLGQYNFFANRYMLGGRIVAIKPDPRFVLRSWRGIAANGSPCPTIN